MKLTNDMELVEGLPVAYIRSLKAIVVSDMHLGYEGAAALRHGTMVPKVNLKKILSTLGEALARHDAGTIIVTGDIKNEFSTVSADEFNELREFILFARARSLRLVLIKGNHDNFVDRYGRAFGLELHSGEMAIGNYLFFHGDQMPKSAHRATMLLMGHEHPAIGIYDAIRGRQRFRCFLHVPFGSAHILVMPAISYFAAGREINAAHETYISPILRKAAMRRAKVYVIGAGATMYFGTLGQLSGI